MMHSAGHRIAPVLAWVAGAIVLVAQVATFWPIFIDDAYISLRYAERLLAGSGLTYTDGEAVEGYTNLLWTLGCAALGALGLDLVCAARLLGAASTAGALAAVVALRRPTEHRTLEAQLVSALVVGATGSLALWTIAGLEAPLVAFEVAATVVLLRPVLDDLTVMSSRRLVLTAISLACLCLTRPDGAMLAGLVIILFVDQHADRRIALRSAAPLAFATLLAVGGQLAFRLAYYDDWLPNTARAKVSLAPAAMLDALDGLETAALYHAPLLIFAAAGLLTARRRGVGRGATFTVGIIIGWCAYAAVVGVRMFAERNLVPLWPLFGMLAGDAIVHAPRSWPRRALRAGTVLLLVALALAQRFSPDLAWARKQMPRHLTQHASAIGEMIRIGFGARDPLLAVDAAGAIPFHAKTRTLDMLGLADRWIARHPPPGFGAGLVGHELGDGEYVLRRAPDIIVSGVKGSPKLGNRTGLQLNDDLRFTQAYQRIFLRTQEPEVRFAAFVRLRGALGLRRENDRWVLPAHLLATSPERRAVLRDGAVVLPLAEGEALELRLPSLPSPGPMSAEPAGLAEARYDGGRILVRAKGSGDLAALTWRAR